METLIELLNEYQKENKRPIFYNYNKESDFFECWSISWIQTFWEIWLTIISKRFGFIKWLVENDKIDIVKVYENLTNYEIEIRIRAVKELLENNEEDTIAYLKLLMLLSISDTPIDDLISYLK